MMRRFLWVLVLVGCGDDGSAVHHDAAVDAPPPPPIDAPPPPAGHYYYVIDKVNVPTSNTQARQYGLDLDDNQTVDNQLGMVIATFSSMGFETQAAQDKAVDTGMETMLADVNTLDFTAATGSTFTLYKGSNPMPSACAGAQDTVCRHHLTGSASFTAIGPADPALTGDFVNGTYTAGPGHLTVQLILFPDAAPVTLTLLGARVKMSSASATAIGNAVIAGGVSMADVDGKVVPAIQVGAMSAVTRDCTALTSPPGCGCMADSTGKNYLGLFDTDHNCAISVDEIRNNSLIVSLLTPDVVVESQMCLSIGVGAHAVPAGFIAPQ